MTLTEVGIHLITCIHVMSASFVHGECTGESRCPEGRGMGEQGGGLRQMVSQFSLPHPTQAFCSLWWLTFISPLGCNRHVFSRSTAAAHKA